MVLSQQSAPLNISAPLTDSEMLQQQMLEGTKHSRAQSITEENTSENEGKRYSELVIERELGWCSGSTCLLSVSSGLNPG